ncbi:amino acid ABC transporter permease, partial [Pseudorhodobacter sp.]|uniref:amino acid ABC transporter permease n=1 Tax=Pseudorhodobacter sp. TaxID=1934400 RepID=UPI0026496430
MSYPDFLATFGPRLANGTAVTVGQFTLASILAVAMAGASGLMLISVSRVVRAGALGYVEIFRGTSLLVQLYWIFFALPIFGLTLDKFTAGILAVGLNGGGYGAILVKGAVMAVPNGQWEAAIAINMTPTCRMLRIILPQAVVIMLPSWGNLLIEILRGTALVALISVTDLMFEVRQINNASFNSSDAFGT